MKPWTCDSNSKNVSHNRITSHKMILILSWMKNEQFHCNFKQNKQTFLSPKKASNFWKTIKTITEKYSFNFFIILFKIWILVSISFHSDNQIDTTFLGNILFSYCIVDTSTNVILLQVNQSSVACETMLNDMEWLNLACLHFGFENRVQPGLKHVASHLQHSVRSHYTT